MLRFYFAPALAGLVALHAVAQNPALPTAPEPAALLATYQLTFQPDSTDKASTRKEVQFLEIGKTFSRFESQGKHLSDSLTATLHNDGVPFTQENAQAMVQTLTSKMQALPRSRFRATIYKTAATRHLYYYDRVGLTTYSYEEPAENLTWTIGPATATVAGYACQQATASFGGRRWNAWFTREVPVAEGPYKFYGLPGLIVQVGDARQHYVYELLSLRKPGTEHLIAPPPKATITSKAAFQRASADFAVDPVGRLSAETNGGARIIMANPEQARQMARDRAKKNNNPLELR